MSGCDDASLGQAKVSSLDNEPATVIDPDNRVQCKVGAASLIKGKLIDKRFCHELATTPY